MIYTNLKTEIRCSGKWKYNNIVVPITILEISGNIDFGGKQ